MIQATPLPSSCGSFQTFAEALRIFLRARIPPECEFSSWANSQVQGGLQSWGRTAAEDVSRVLLGRAQALRRLPPRPHASPLRSYPQPHRLQDHRVLEKSYWCLPRAETPVQRTGACPTAVAATTTGSVGPGGNDKV